MGTGVKVRMGSKMKKRLFLWILLGFIICGCSPDMKTQDYSQTSCSWFNKIRTCKLTYAYIEGFGTSIDVKESHFPSRTAVDINMHADLSRGRVKIWFHDPQGNEKVTFIDAGGKVDITGTAAVNSDSKGPYFTLFLEPQGGSFWEKPRIENLVIDLNYHTDT
jgi:hypothetical protein